MLQITEYCRTCMKSNTNLEDLFQPLSYENCSSIISNLLMEYTGMEISRDDGLPQNICRDCLKVIKTIYTFRTQALQVESEFKKIISLQNVKNEQIKEELKTEKVEVFDPALENFLFNTDFIKEEMQEILSLDSVEDNVCNDLNFANNENTHKTENKLKESTSNNYLLKVLNVQNSIMCTICNKPYRNISSLNKHLMIHRDKDSLKCNMCGQYFQTKELLLEHTLDHNIELAIKIDTDEEKLYKCMKCDMSYSKRRSLAMHLKKHKVLNVHNAIMCTICNKPYRNTSSLNKHLMIHRDKDSLKCNMCGQYFQTKELLLEHTLDHNIELAIKTDTDEEKLYKCMKCDMSYSKRRSLAMHLKKHKGDNGPVQNKLFICDVCKKEFSSKALLKRHLQRHYQANSFQCNKCTKTYYRQDQFQEHMKKHSGIKPHVCSYCNKGFVQLCSLKEHQRTHTRETPFLCSECGKGFSNRSNLRQHMIRHTGIKPFSCRFCPKTFCTKGQMTSHMATHTGAQPHSCDECGARFTKINSLKKHRLLHSGIKPYCCETCKQCFSCKDHLKRHYRVHTGEKPYKCNHCDRAFTQSNDLIKHKRKHEGQNLYRCTICGMAFRLAIELKRHYPIHYINGDVTVPIGKGIEAPVLIMKPEEMQRPNDIDPRITITINNGLDKNGLAGDITIDINPQKS